jgi:TetR/AcrR family transcriptional repressor of mexJK operon
LSKKSLPASQKSRPVARPRPRAGRPTKAQAERRHAQLLDRALDFFLDNGYELATIEMIRTSIGMTKRTLYSLYEDKKMLFRAAVQRALTRWVIPIDALRAVETDDLEATLIAIARIRMENSISPIGLKLQRIVNAESYRVPEVIPLYWEQGGRPSIRYVADLLERHAKQGRILADEPEMLAHGFLMLVVGGPTRAILLGAKVDKAEIDSRIRVYVKLFLDGVRTRG